MTTLTAVRSTLKAADTDHAILLSSIIDKSKVGPYKSNFDSPARQRFGQYEIDYPGLGKRISPFDAGETPSLKQLQDISLQELSEVRAYFGDRSVYHAPSESDKGGDQDPSIQLINSLTGAGVEFPESIVNFPSETLDTLILDSGYKDSEDDLNRSSTRCTILPNNTLLPISHSNEGTTCTTLLTGEIIWIIWPPTNHNLQVLQSAYEAFTTGLDLVTLDIAHKLEGGITFVQSAGDGLHIPPFCPILILATKTSVLATYTTVTVEQYVAILPRLPLLHAWFSTEQDGQTKRSAFNVALLKFLDAILHGEPDKDEPNLENIWDEHIPKLLKTWDDVKSNVASILGPANAKALKDIWADYLVARKGRACGICEKVIKNKRRDMRKHFVEKHWVDRKKKTIHRVEEDDGNEMGDIEGDEPGEVIVVDK